MRALAIAALSILPFSAMAQETPEFSKEQIESCIKAPDFDEIVCHSPAMEIQATEYLMGKLITLDRKLKREIKPETLCAIGYEQSHDQLWLQCLYDARTEYQEYKDLLQNLDAKPIMEKIDERLSYINSYLPKSSK